MQDTPLEIPQGTTWTQVLQWLDPTGNPYDVTGYSAELQMRSSYSDCYAYLTLSTAASTILVNGPSGIFTLTATPTVTTALSPNTYVYDLKVTSPGGTVTRLIEGHICVSAEVTQ